jgi:cell division septal protein FtsQ
MISPLSLHQESSVLPPEDIVQKTSELLQKFNIASKNVSIATGEAILITLKDGQEVIFSEKKQLAEQMASLQLIVNRLTIEGRKFIRIDFRFNSPVVSF